MVAPIIWSQEILIVDDHPIYRKGLIALLDQMEPDTALLQANDAAQALALIAENDDLDVVILDLVIPGMDGCESPARAFLSELVFARLSK
jgi:DNA-binding NarL/FixJ family response regulator